MNLDRYTSGKALKGSENTRGVICCEQTNWIGCAVSEAWQGQKQEESQWPGAECSSVGQEGHPFSRVDR